MRRHDRYGKGSRYARLIGGLAFTLFLSACSSEPRTDSLLLITLDTTRADHLGAYGYEAAQTPTLNRLATAGTLYELAYSPVPETLPSHTTMLTGLYPPSHGVRLNLNFQVPSAATTLAEILVGKGFETAAVVAAEVLNARYGLAQGFEVYDDPPLSRRGLVERPGEEVTERALEAASRFAPGRFFLWVHYYDAHSPYQPREPFQAPEGAQPESAQLYDREIAYMDHWVGELLAGLKEQGRLEEAAILVAGDHGESLGEHGETYHTLYIYDSTQHVPLILKGPGIPAGRRVERPVATVDLFATALTLLGVPMPEGVTSQPLPGLGIEAAAPADDAAPIYSESMAPPLRFGWSALQAVRAGGWLYVRAPREELYDTRRDPNQQVNLAWRYPDQLADMRRLLGQALRAMPDSGLAEDAGYEPGDEEAARLASLGYLSASEDAAALDQPLAGEDPKDMVEVSEAFQLSRLARRLGRRETAEELLYFVVTADPENPAGWLHYGEVLLEQRRFKEARAALERALELRPSSHRTLMLLAATERELGDSGAARWHLKAALRTSPFAPGEMWRDIGRLRLALGDWEGAVDAYRQVLENLPGDRRATWAIEQIEARQESAAGAEVDATAGSAAGSSSR